MFCKVSSSSKTENNFFFSHVTSSLHEIVGKVCYNVYIKQLDNILTTETFYSVLIELEVKESIKNQNHFVLFNNHGRESPFNQRPGIVPVNNMADVNVTDLMSRL